MKRLPKDARVAASECVAIIRLLAEFPDSSPSTVIARRLLEVVELGPGGALTEGEILEAAHTLQQMLRPQCDCSGPHCVECGCCEHQACPGGCVWAGPNLCSQCAREAKVLFAGDAL